MRTQFQIIQESEAGVKSIIDTITGAKKRGQKRVAAATQGIIDDMINLEMTNFVDEITGHPMESSLNSGFTSFWACVMGIPEMKDPTVDKAISLYEKNWKSTMQICIDDCDPPLTHSYVQKFHDDFRLVVIKRMTDMLRKGK